MNNEISPSIDRPPIGFIVEGHGEYHAYPSIANRIVGTTGMYIPISNAKGCGNILNHLEENLDDLVTVAHPSSVIITLDLRENIRRGNFNDCAELKVHVENKIDEWLTSRSTNIKFRPLPNDIECVIQVISFETWLIADLQGLRDSGFLAIEDNLSWQNVDAEVNNPCNWINSRQLGPYDLKKPQNVKKLVHFLTPESMSSTSRSFLKFHREVERKYNEWAEACYS